MLPNRRPTAAATAVCHPELAVAAGPRKSPHGGVTSGGGAREGDQDTRVLARTWCLARRLRADLSRVYVTRLAAFMSAIGRLARTPRRCRAVRVA